MAVTPTAHRFRIRPIAAADRDRLRAFYAGLSEDSRESRFHGATTGISDRAAVAFCEPDHDHREGFVVEALDGGHPPVIGHLCLEPVNETDVEVAVAVADAYQGRGLGHALLVAAIDWARSHDYRRVVATVRPTNGPMFGLLRSTGLPVDLRPADADEVEATLELAVTLPRAA
ncbi:MAG TPA: GNAT family N-acetyltransferase [Candidatus Limnocylindrales bacterium]|jgi:acetyltransferase